MAHLALLGNEEFSGKKTFSIYYDPGTVQTSLHIHAWVEDEFQHVAGHYEFDGKQCHNWKQAKFADCEIHCGVGVHNVTLAVEQPVKLKEFRVYTPSKKEGIELKEA